MITIKCPRCLTDNLYDAEFCRQCGLRLANDCPKCNASNPHQFTYCTQCGTSLERGQVSPVLATKEETKPETDKSEAKEEPKLEVKEEVSSEEAQEPAAEKPETQEPQITAPTELKEEVKHLESVIATIKEEAKETEKPIVTTPIPEKEQKTAETKPSPEEEALKIKTPVRVSTGIVDLDPLIGGGFLSGKVYLVSGESGTGKTIFGLQFLHQGLIEGENGIYISGDEKPGHLVVDAESLGWNFRKYVEQKKLGLFDISPYFYGERTGKAVEVDVLTVVNDLQRHVKEIGAKRIVIDTIAPLVFGQENLAYIQAYTKNLVSAIEDNLECTAVITSGILSGSLSLSRYGVEEFVAEGVIVLGIDSFGCHHARTLSIRKMRSTYSDLKDHIFDIVPQRGIVLKDY
jgi:circadian clock protein KaiC